MNSWISRRVLVALAIGLAACGDDEAGPAQPDQAEPATAGCHDGRASDSPALYQVCYPASWNGDLVVYAHGYIPGDQPLAVPDDEVDGQSVAQIVTSTGAAYAGTSYRANGLVADQAVGDVAQLVADVRQRFEPDPARVFVVGVSEGGLVAALSAEQHPELFAGALAACGPVGDFTAQIDYFGDFRVLFDWYFPDVIPGGPVDVPDSVRTQWSTVFVPRIIEALQNDPLAALELLVVAGAPHDPQDLLSVGTTVIGALSYDVFALVDARARLGGQPYDNVGRQYHGSPNDAGLNAGVARVTADPAARAGLATFETTGAITIPVSLVHTTGDPIVPSAQSELYAAKVAGQGAAGLLELTTVDRFGHCSFTQSELLDAFAGLLGRASAAARVD
ncbi:MAG TPA: alpha/beta hydrolase [Gemmatimonadales bacterium]|jgi:pimeloyl-ACP methyl ester carboxylesterase|nr:alpha/beta hydrolase [Gemmatimonadales bacterium]